MDDVVGAEFFLGVDAVDFAHSRPSFVRDRTGTGKPKTQAPKPSLVTLRVSSLPRKILKCGPLSHSYGILFSRSEPPAKGR